MFLKIILIIKLVHILIMKNSSMSEIETFFVTNIASKKKTFENYVCNKERLYFGHIASKEYKFKM